MAGVFVADKATISGFLPSRFESNHLQPNKENTHLSSNQSHTNPSATSLFPNPQEQSPILEPTMNTAKALFRRALRLPKAAASGQLRHLTTSPPSLRAANHRRRDYTPPSSFPPERLPAWFSNPPKLPHGVETWEIVLVLGLPVVIIGWIKYMLHPDGQPDDWENPEKRVVRQKPEPLELFLRIRRPFFRVRRPVRSAPRQTFRELPRFPSREVRLRRAARLLWDLRRK